MSFPEPRAFQTRTLEKLRAGFREGHRSQLIMAPTGSGKTYMGLHLISEALKKGKKALFVCDRKTLIEQTSETADRYGLIEHGVIQADHWRRNTSPFQICSAQTLAKRGMPNSDLIIVDECHTQLKAWTDHVPHTKAAVIGLSATPFAKGLGKLFTNVVVAETMHQLTEDGVLVPMRVLTGRAITHVNMDGAATKSNGEWTDEAQTERGLEIIGDVVTEWQKHAAGLKTIVFGATIKHCEAMASQFNGAGIMAACFTQKTTDKEREQLLNEYRRPDSQLKILVSVQALAKGFDVPDVACVCDVRPMRKSLSEVIQMWGRGLRSHPDKERCLLLDFCIASGQRVLTDRGLVPIEAILLSDKLWDGHEFVAHKGVVSRGFKRTIEYSGLVATPCHAVKTKAGWRTLGDCAEEQTPIIKTGFGRHPVREREGYISGLGLAGSARWAARSCFMRMRSMWVSFLHSVVGLAEGQDQRMPSLQPAQTGSEVALCAMRQHEAKMQESQFAELQRLWRSGDRVPFQYDQRSGGLDSFQPRNTGGLDVDGLGSDRQQRSLRTRESSMGFKTPEHIKSESRNSGTADAPVQASISNRSIRGYLASFVSICGDVFRGDSRAMGEAFPQAEREVWDILDCGPRNSFTCEGLLVHNSGNRVRFASDFEDFYFNGIEKLDDGEKLDKTIRKDEPNEARPCPKCGASPFGRRCVSCGFERKSAEAQQHQPGELIAFEVGKHKVERRDLWAHCLTLAVRKGKTTTAEGWASHLYKSIAGNWPPRVRLGVADLPLIGDINPAVIAKEHANRIAWSKAQQKERAS